MSDGGTAAEVLARFKASETFGQATMLAADAVLRNIVIVWPLVPLEWDSEAQIAAGPRWRQWKALWQTCQIDVGDLAIKVGCPTALVLRCLERAMGGQLIYPDSTVNTKVGSVVQALVAKELPKSATSGKAKASSPEHGDGGARSEPDGDGNGPARERRK